MQFPLPPPAPPLMIAVAVRLRLNPVLTQMAENSGNCDRVTLALIAVIPP